MACCSIADKTSYPKELDLCWCSSTNMFRHVQISRFHTDHSTVQNVVCVASFHGNWKWQQCHTSRSLSDPVLMVMAKRASSIMSNEVAAKTPSNQTKCPAAPCPPKPMPASIPHPTTATSPMCLPSPLVTPTCTRAFVPAPVPPPCFRTNPTFAHSRFVSKPRARQQLLSVPNLEGYKALHDKNTVGTWLAEVT